MHIETIAARAGHAVDPTTGALTPPIHLSTTFERDPDGEYSRGFVYSRSGNPNRDALEHCLTALEGGQAAAAFASGSAATLAVLQSLAPGDHVVAPLDAYHGTTKLLREILGPWGLESSFVDTTDLSLLRQAIRPNTRLVLLETPSNPLLKVTDIAAAAEIAHAAGALCACDNTWATPILQRPLDLGADLAIHATTKYLSGHSDVLGGAVIAREDSDQFQRIRLIQTAGGGVHAPFDCWLVLRGIRTLPLRMRAHCAGARQVADFLQGHPKIAAVHYPGLPSHVGHAIAARQMSDFGGMLSVEVRGGRDQAFALAAAVRVFTRATSLGGTESLIEHRASVEGPRTKTPSNLLRLSVGLEHPDDLIEDLAGALAGLE